MFKGASLSSYYASSAFDPPEDDIVFPDVAIKFENLKEWIEGQFIQDGFGDDSWDLAGDAIDLFLVGYFARPEVAFPSNLPEIESAMDAAKAEYRRIANDEAEEIRRQLVVALQERDVIQASIEWLRAA